MKKLVSYLLPIFNEEKNINYLYETLIKLLDKELSYNFEIIFINDGSNDDSLSLLYKLQERDGRIIVINFARNFGHQIAITAGLDLCKGDCAIIMDSDLQDPPSVSVELIKKWENGFDIVYAQRRSRKDSLFKKATANIFYLLISKITDIDIPRNVSDFRLIDHKVIDTLKTFREHNRFLRGLVSYMGYKQTAVPFDRDKRYAGKTGYPLKKMLKFAGDGIFGFSTLPLRLISRVGYIISVLSFVGILYALWVKLYNPKLVISGWTFTIIAILLVGGIQLIMLGVLGGYIGRIYTESQNRPLYWLESVHYPNDKQ